MYPNTGAYKSYHEQDGQGRWSAEWIAPCMRDKKEEEINMFDRSANREENSRQLRSCQTVAKDSEAELQAEEARSRWPPGPPRG